jgi:hypothetical protein
MSGAAPLPTTLEPSIPVAGVPAVPIADGAYASEQNSFRRLTDLLPVHRRFIAAL